jgi:pimeloyl-ACP methyl ester carboxylesterase
LDGVRLPVVVAAGARDNFLPVFHARRLAESLPDAELVTFPRTGHLLVLEDPAGFNALVARVAAPGRHRAGRA